MKIFDDFKNKCYEDALDRAILAEELRTRFVKDFPISRISSLTLDEYLIAKDGYGNPSSFCRRLRYDLDNSAHLGNSYNDIFGIYLSGGTKLTLSGQYRKYKDDYQGAFDKIKGQIIAFLDDMKNDRFENFDKYDHTLYSSFRMRLLLTYYPEKIIPVCVNEKVDEYCHVFGISSDDNILNKALLLRKIKDSFPSCSNWSNVLFMLFCDWMADNKIVMEINGLRRAVDKCDCLLNEKLLEQAIEWYVDYCVRKTGKSNFEFSNDLIGREEGYKKEIAENAHKSLSCDSWVESMIGTGEILECVINAFKAKSANDGNNLVTKYNITSFKEKAEKDIKKAERILYDIFSEEKYEDGIENACEFWGRRYPEFAYLFFAKDYTKYAPVRPRTHKKRFNQLDIDISCLDKFSWENYCEYNLIHERIRESLEEYFGVSVSLLDAHSFVWFMHHASEDFAIESDSIVEEINKSDNPLESVVITSGEKEGKSIARYVTKYERSSKNRLAAIKCHGYKCQACGFDFQDVYGDIGKDFIEVHHTKPLYSLDEEVVVNPKTDLACLCANCHRMIHRKRGAIMTVAELREIVNKNVE